MLVGGEELHNNHHAYRQLLEEAIRENSTLTVVAEYRRRLKALMQPAVLETDRLARLQE